MCSWGIYSAEITLQVLIQHSFFLILHKHNDWTTRKNLEVLPSRERPAARNFSQDCTRKHMYHMISCPASETRWSVPSARHKSYFYDVEATVKFQFVHFPVKVIIHVPIEEQEHTHYSDVAFTQNPSAIYRNSYVSEIWILSEAHRFIWYIVSLNQIFHGSTIICLIDSL